jgi:hypothetical protein
VPELTQCGAAFSLCQAEELAAVLTRLSHARLEGRGWLHRVFDDDDEQQAGIQASGEQPVDWDDDEEDGHQAQEGAGEQQPNDGEQQQDGR